MTTSSRFPKMSVKCENDLTTPPQYSSTPGLQQPQIAVSNLLQDATRCFVSVSTPALLQASSVVASVQPTPQPNQQLGMVTLNIYPLLHQQNVENLGPTVNSVLTSLLNVLNKQKATSGTFILPTTTKVENVDRDYTKDDKDNSSDPEDDLPLDALQQKLKMLKTSFVCNICNRSMPSEHHLLRHTIGSHQKISCDVCDKTFRNRQRLTRHLLIHEARKPYLCEICGWQFTQKTNMKQHMLTHRDERPYRCKQCPKTFPSPGRLRTHVYTHTGEKPHSCEICGKAFVQVFRLKTHLRVHTTEKPFICRVCGKAFKYKPTFKRHQRRRCRS